MNNQEQEKVTQVVKDIIVDRTTEMVENMSNHDFIEYVMDRLEEEGVKLDFESDEVQEQIHDIVGGQVLPLLVKIMSWSLNGKELPTLN